MKDNEKEDVKILLSNVSSPEVISLFSEYDDYIINLLGRDRVYYTRYTMNEHIHDVWLAYRDDIPVGCVAYRIMSPGIGEIKRMFIKSEYRGCGIAKLLLTTTEKHARGRGDSILHLCTRTTLEPAITLYRRFGFVESLQEGLYVEMEKRLSWT